MHVTSLGDMELRGFQALACMTATRKHGVEVSSSQLVQAHADNSMLLEAALGGNWHLCCAQVAMNRLLCHTSGALHDMRAKWV